MTAVNGGEDVDHTLPERDREADPGAVLADLVTQAQDGSAEALSLLRQLLRDNVSLWQSCGDLARCARDAQLDLLASGNLLVRESVLCKMQAIEEQLKDQNDSPLVGLLVERIGLCWLQAYSADIKLAESSGSSAAHDRFLRRRAETAHRQYMAAIKQLATVRKLLAPSRGKQPSSGKTCTK